MTTLKEIVYKILVDYPETRDSDKKLIWEVWIKNESSYFYSDGEECGLCSEIITKEDFMKAPSPESIRRVRQQLQREDLLLGKNLIQPTKEIKQKRVKLSKERGFSYIQGKFNTETLQYEINS